MVNPYKWSDQLGPRSRGAFLILGTQDALYEFAGKTIPGIAVIYGEDYTKEGRWSHTTYQLQLADGVRPIAGHAGWGTGKFLEGLREATRAYDAYRWMDVANALGVTLSVAQAFLRAARPRSAEVLDRVEQEIGDLAVVSASEDIAVVSITFGSPTNRMRAAGYWDWPICVVAPDGGIVDRIYMGERVYASSSGRSEVLVQERGDGMHGGTVSLRVAVPEGCTLSLRPSDDAETDAPDESHGVHGGMCTIGDRLDTSGKSW